MEDPEENSQLYGQLIFNKARKKNGKKKQQMVLGNLDGDMQKNETGPLSYTTHKNKFKMCERPKCQTGNHQNPRGENRQQPL